MIKFLVPVEESLPERIRRRTGRLSAGHQRVARFCVTEPEKAGTLTALRIAEELRMSESTVVRFAVLMGYRGFPDMQAAIRHSLQPSDKDADASEPARLRGPAGAALQNDVRMLKETIASLDETRFAAAMEELYRSEMLYVCGFRTAFSLAFLAEFHIRQIRRSVRLIDALGGTQVDDMAQMRNRDALLAFTFPVYDERTIEVINHAARAGAACVVVTDSVLAPLPISKSVHILKVRPDGLSFFNSNVSATAVLNAMVTRLLEMHAVDDPDLEARISKKFQHPRTHQE